MRASLFEDNTANRRLEKYTYDLSRFREHGRDEPPTLPHQFEESRKTDQLLSREITGGAPLRKLPETRLDHARPLKVERLAIHGFHQWPSPLHMRETPPFLKEVGETVIDCTWRASYCSHITGYHGLPSG